MDGLQKQAFRTNRTQHNHQIVIKFEHGIQKIKLNKSVRNYMYCFLIIRYRLLRCQSQKTKSKGVLKPS